MSEPPAPAELAGGKLVLDHPAEAVARLRLNNPEKRNPLDHDVLDAIAEVLPELDRGIEVRCVLITGTGRAFSAGYDIGAIPAESAKLGMPPAKLGLIYGHTGLERFIDVIGVAHTRDLFLTGRVLEAAEALHMGLVGRVVPDEAIEGAALALAGVLASNAPLSMKGNKHAIETLARFGRLTDEQERELVELRESCFASEDFREGVQAFAEKREPRWRGR